MKKIILTTLTLFILFAFSLVAILSTIGIETDKFNNLIIKKISQTNNKINLKIGKINFKLDLKKMKIFLETINPKITMKESLIPAKNVKVYIDFFSLIKSKPEIDKIILSLNQLSIFELKKISVNFKPSNLNSFLNNNIKQGQIDSEIEIFFSKENTFENFITRGSVSNLEASLFDNLSLKNASFNFFADSSDILIKSFFGEMQPFKINDGDIRIKLDPNIIIESSFNAKINYDKNLKENYKFIEKNSALKNILNLESDLINTFKVNLDKTYKIKSYKLSSKGGIIKGKVNFDDISDLKFINSENKSLSFKNTEINILLDSNKKSVDLSGEYAFNEEKFFPFDLENLFENDFMKLKVNADYDRPINIDLINFSKPQGIVTSIFIDLEKFKDLVRIKEFKLKDNKNIIHVIGSEIQKGNLVTLKKIKIKSSRDGKINNDFSVNLNKKISIKGLKFDATNLPKILNQKNEINNLIKINKEIEINFNTILAPLSEEISNFNLIGKIEKGKFTKISSKGNFEGNNYLDILMKSDGENKTKYLEIYSDLARPLLTEFKFFKGLTGGKLFYTSIIDDEYANSSLKIENFKVINAPGMVKLLSLADLGGLADLVEGEGLSFDILEIKFEKEDKTLKLNEILALGPSISVLMEGYQTPEVTSLSGTLVPAKTLNKLISKIPVLGDIVIPKEVGEGLFGISFKMKGPPNKIKTTINPIRTITPRFIQKIIDRNKDSK